MPDYPNMFSATGGPKPANDNDPVSSRIVQWEQKLKEFKNITSGGGKILDFPDK